MTRHNGMKFRQTPRLEIRIKGLAGSLNKPAGEYVAPLVAVAGNLEQQVNSALIDSDSGQIALSAWLAGC